MQMLSSFLIKNDQSEAQIKRACICVFLTCSMFIEPLSSTGKSILITLSIIAILSLSTYRQQCLQTLQEGWCVCILLMIVSALLGCLYGPAIMTQKLLMLEKYNKILYVPLLAVGFQSLTTRFYGMQAFIAAILFTCVLSILKCSHIFDSLIYSCDYVFRNHIMTGIMVSFAAYLCLMMAFKFSPKYRSYYILVWLVLTYQNLFISAGRTGYIIYFMLMIVCVFQLLTIKKTLYACIFISLLFFLAYELSGTMHDGLNLIISDWVNFDRDMNTSVGIRMQFHQYAKDLFLRSPIWGNGLGSFSFLVQSEHPINTALQEPHSQYWLIASELGIIGLAAFGFLISGLFSIYLKLREMKPILLALLIIFLAGNTSDSLLLYSGSGYFFVLFFSLCIGELVAIDRAAKVNTRDPLMP